MDFSINKLLASSAAAYDQAKKEEGSSAVPLYENKEKSNQTIDALSATLANAAKKSEKDEIFEDLLGIDSQLSDIESELSGYGDYSKLELDTIKNLLARLDEIQKSLNKIDEALEKIISSNKLKDTENRMIDSNIERSAMLRAQMDAQRKAMESSEKTEIAKPVIQ